MNRTLLLAAAVFALVAPMDAQVVSKGTVQIGLGLNAGGFATQYDSEISILGFTKKDSHRDGALSMTFPLEVQYNITDRFGLGLYLEPGSYIDSAGTHPNKLFLLGLSPRFYVVNGDHFTLDLHADLGLANLQIRDVQNGKERFTDHFDGRHFRAGVRGQYYFGQAFGLHADLRLAGANFNWSKREPRDPLIDAVNYKATLKVTGVQFELGAQVRF